MDGCKIPKSVNGKNCNNFAHPTRHFIIKRFSKAPMKTFNPQKFIHQNDTEPLLNILERFASRFHGHKERQDFLRAAGIETNFINKLNLNANPKMFAFSFLTASKDFHVTERKPDYHPFMRFLNLLVQADKDDLDDHEILICDRLIASGRNNLKALKACSAVGMIETADSQGIGAGVCLGNHILLTCQHLFNLLTPQQAWVRFGYREQWHLSIEANLLELDLDTLSGDMLPDYALIKINGDLNIQPVKISNQVLNRGSVVRMIHHPGGGPMVISEQGRIIIVDEEYITHTIDTDQGSSGAPIFNSEWELVAIHRGDPGIGRSIQDGTKEGVPLHALRDKIDEFKM